MASIHDRGRKRPKRWQVKYRTADGAQRGRSFRTVDEAKAFAATVDVELRAGSYVDPQLAAQTFGPFAAQVVRSWQHRLRPTSMARTRSTLDAQILPRWADARLGRIERFAVQEWVDGLTAAGLAPSTVHKAAQVFAKILQAATDERIIRDNPARRIELPRIEKHEARFLEPAEVDRLAAAIGLEHRAFVYLGALCGLRAGELFGLRWRDVNLLARTVEIRSIITEANGVQHEGPPKTAASRRRVPLPRLVIDELVDHAGRQGGPGPDRFVFPTPEGKPWRATNFRTRVWRPACAAADLDGLVIHELRHSAVAGWIEAGAEPAEVAARAGHRSVVTIYDRYGHRFPAQADRVNDALDELYRRARE
jgi:integrase